MHFDKDGGWLMIMPLSEIWGMDHQITSRDLALFFEIAKLIILRF